MIDWSEVKIKKFRGLLCDLDNTLYEYDICNRNGMDALKQWSSVKYNILEEAFENYWKLSRQMVHRELESFGAGHSRLLYAQKFTEQYFGHTHPAFILEAEEI